MSDKFINRTTREINRNLHDLDRVVNGVLYTMSYFDFEKHFDLLVTEISRRESLTRQNKDILGNYYSMCTCLEYSYEIWDRKNYETHPDREEIYGMYAAIYNSCNLRVLPFLNAYDSENSEVVRSADDEPVSIQPFIDEIENARHAGGLFGRLVESLAVRPGAFGISIDVKRLFRK